MTYFEVQGIPEELTLFCASVMLCMLTSYILTNPETIIR